MRLWRLSAHARFDAQGARRFGGRWNPAGVSVIYTAATLALATLELLVHVDRELVPRHAVAHYVDAPDDVPVERLDAARLPTGWQRYPAPEALQEIGLRWVSAAKSLLLAVPSSVLRVPTDLTPGERNYLVNPAHPDFARLRVRSVRIALDPRMWR